MKNSNLQISANPVLEIAQNLEVAAREAIESRGRFSLALSGGSTPKALYQLLASEEWNHRIEWPKCDVFFGDERAVSPDDALSNFKMASEALLNHVPARVFRMEGERADLENAARDYQNALQDTCATLDLVLLGLGDDGHTASLFPHSPQLNVTETWVTATPVASLEPHVRRLTLTFAAINAARRVWFLASGEAKSQKMKEVLHGARDVETLPAQGVAPRSGELKWFVDEAAARLVA
ncbi:6-phosphogluconolactonase [Abditibacterium utsteinense]|uniref:6-phosphogluconolactonase n=1 Tax=Abditibacterium utsteinense TaxID=1960156 RepID=A0A2S8STW6_9BACT|nr:6-phosphogluconolactonase [Abditibacterium utsteinense]PQV64241.1 6-phosphogluconolactonase [Abditibacterium utsteinense]